MRNKFMFFENFKATADKLNSEQRLAFYDAITDYVFYDKEPTDPIISALLEAIKPSLDKIDGREKNGGNHNISGKNQHTKNTTNPVNSGQSRSILVNSGQSLIETETENIIETETENIIETETETETVIEKEITKEKEIKKDFDIFWETYIPVKATDGCVVAKGSKKVAFEKYVRIVKSGTKPEDILRGLKNYIEFCQKNNRLTCGVPVFLNQERWKDDYNPITVMAQIRRPLTQRELQDLEYEQKKAALLAKIEKRKAQ